MEKTPTYTFSTFGNAIMFTMIEGHLFFQRSLSTKFLT
jgi:hypothetical protein